jgi:hypothetical protein
MSDDEVYQLVLATLLNHRYRPSEIPPVVAAGVYALFLTDPVALPALTVPTSGALYVGMAELSLKDRNHFVHGDSGFSSPRRSLGSLLKDELRLTAIRRGTGSSLRNIAKFRFPDDGEQRLSAWMDRYLRYSLARVSSDVRAVERRLIGELKPPLNLTHWPNPQAAHLRSLRRACRDEAARSTAHTLAGAV